MRKNRFHSQDKPFGEDFIISVSISISIKAELGPAQLSLFLLGLFLESRNVGMQNISVL